MRLGIINFWIKLIQVANQYKDPKSIGLGSIFLFIFLFHTRKRSIQIAGLWVEFWGIKIFEGVF
jgi:hypothetical protein